MSGNRRRQDHHAERDLDLWIPANERIVTIEDAAELQLHQEHVLRLESRPPNIEGKGAVTIRDLVRNALRMRPDRIIVGEVVDAAALDMLQAMNTGHDGSITTIHANGPRDALARIETMVLMAGVDLPSRHPRATAHAIDLIVHQSRLKDGTRRITHVPRSTAWRATTSITLQNIFRFDHGMGFDEDGKSLGRLRSTGLRPKFLEKLAHSNVMSTRCSSQWTGSDQRDESIIPTVGQPYRDRGRRLHREHARSACFGPLRAASTTCSPELRRSRSSTRSPM